MTVIKLNKDNFDKEVKESKTPVIVDFFASWCGPCQSMAPIFDELSEEVKGVKFAKLSTETDPEIASLYAIRSIPCFIVFKNGEEVDRVIGGMPRDVMKKMLEEIQ